MLAVARRRSGANIQMPNGNAITIANNSATTSGKSRTPSRCPAPTITTVIATTSSKRARAYSAKSATRRDLGRLSDTGPSLPTARIFGTRRFVVVYLFAILVLAALVYVGLRLMRANATRPRPRTIGPDDDPEFLRRLGPEGKPR